jgi:hypothetical protein
VVLELVERLQQISDRHQQAANSLTRIAVRLAAEQHPMTVAAALESYIKADLPSADAALEIMEALEGTQSPEWRERRMEQRKTAARRRLEWHFDCGRDAGPAPE